MGSAVDLDMSERLVEVEVPSDQGTGTMRCYVPCRSLPIFSSSSGMIYDCLGPVACD